MLSLEFVPVGAATCPLTGFTGVDGISLLTSADTTSLFNLPGRVAIALIVLPATEAASIGPVYFLPFFLVGVLPSVV